MKIDYFKLGHDYDVTVKVYLGRWYLFWYGKRPLAVLWYQLHVSAGFIFKFIGGGVLQKRLGRKRVNEKTINL